MDRGDHGQGTAHLSKEHSSIIHERRKSALKQPSKRGQKEHFRIILDDEDRTPLPINPPVHEEGQENLISSSELGDIGGTRSIRSEKSIAFFAGWFTY